MNFRKDINGLRAIAVLAVVLFHFNEAWMPGGFAGVDVFFVISGFLMTGIITRGIDQGNFSIISFYSARANRILPALAVLCLVLMIFGWIKLSPIDYKELAWHTGSSLGFFSNIVYWNETGYFDDSAHGKWLLHTWSLSAEWQFYMIYPIVLVAMRKVLSPNVTRAIILLGAVFCFIFCVVATYKWPSPAYYLLPARAWEMLVGAVAFMFPLKINEEKKWYFELLGFTLIVGSYFLISKNEPWPGYLAIFPVLGSFLLIQSQRNDSAITGNVIFQKIGKWSYSIYLWHWPLAVAIHNYSLSEIYAYVFIPVSIVLGFVSYRYVESGKFGKRSNYFSFPIYLKPFQLGLFVALASFFVYENNGYSSRLSDELQIRNAKALEAIGDWDYPESDLRIGRNSIRFIKGTSEKNILFIGGSHVEQLYPYVKKFHGEYNVYFLTEAGCFVSRSYNNPKWSCDNIQEYKSLMLDVGFEKVVTSIYLIDGYLPIEKEQRELEIKKRIFEYDEFLKFAKENSERVFMLLGEPRGKEFDPKLSVRDNLRNYVTIDEVRENYNLHYDALNELSETNGLEIIDPVNYLCQDKCYTMDEESNFFYRDSTHMRPWYAAESLQYLNTILH